MSWLRAGLKGGARIHIPDPVCHIIASIPQAQRTQLPWRMTLLLNQASPAARPIRMDISYPLSNYLYLPSPAQPTSYLTGDKSALACEKALRLQRAWHVIRTQRGTHWSQGRKGYAWSYSFMGPPGGHRAPTDGSWHSQCPWPVHFPSAKQEALTLSLLCSDRSAYTEPYKVCPISAAAPKEDLTSDDEQGSSDEEDTAPRDPSLTQKVGRPPQ